MTENKNKGFSLIELIVVIAIMTGLTIGLVMSISAVTKREVTQSAKSLVSSLQYTQNSAMAKSLAYVALEKREDGYYLRQVEGKGEKQRVEERKLCSAKTQISFTTSRDTTPCVIEEAKPLILSFDKSSGAYLPVIRQIEQKETFVYETFLDETDTLVEVYCTSIQVKQEEKQETIQLYQKTGKTKREEG